MSAIAKPLIHFTNAENASLYVGVDHINAVTSLDVAGLPNTPASANRYYIVFNYQYPNGDTKVTKVSFKTSAARNTSLTNFKAAMSTAVA